MKETDKKFSLLQKIERLRLLLGASPQSPSSAWKALTTSSIQLYSKIKEKTYWKRSPISAGNLHSCGGQYLKKS